MSNNTEKDLTVFTNVNFDKNDVILVAVAKAEKQLRKNVKEEMEKQKAAEERVKEIDELLDKEADTYPHAVKLIVKKVTELAKMYDVDAKEVKPVIDIEHEINYGYGDSEPNEEGNRYTVSYKHRRSGYVSIRVIKDTPLTAIQKNLCKQKRTAKEEAQIHQSTALEWKRKLSDIDTFERQIKAYVIEQSLGTTEEGKKLLESMDKNFENTIKMIGF